MNAGRKAGVPKDNAAAAIPATFVGASASAYSMLGAFAAWSGSENLQILLQKPVALGVTSAVLVIGSSMASAIETIAWLMPRLPGGHVLFDAKLMRACPQAHHKDCDETKGGDDKQFLHNSSNPNFSFCSQNLVERTAAGRVGET